MTFLLQIEHVHSVYDLNRKVTAAIIDNGSNFIKIFTAFSSSVTDCSSATSLPSPDIQDDDNDLDEKETTFESVSDTLTLDKEQEQDRDLTQLEYELPAHEGCTTHSLNSVVSFDVDKYLSFLSLSRSVYRSSLLCTLE